MNHDLFVINHNINNPKTKRFVRALILQNQNSMLPRNRTFHLNSELRFYTYYVHNVQPVVPRTTCYCTAIPIEPTDEEY